MSPYSYSNIFVPIFFWAPIDRLTKPTNTITHFPFDHWHIPLWHRSVSDSCDCIGWTHRFGDLLRMPSSN